MPPLWTRHAAESGAVGAMHNAGARYVGIGRPPKVILKIIKICRGFLWAGAVDARGGQCSVALDIVCCRSGLVASVYQT